ncbi:MAG: prenyltransferase/squalene oxidase repeat-containing protein [bacterium]|nr:prenyltransferase/squalene oxidase repeat-containing protein [bacterium]
MKKFKIIITALSFTFITCLFSSTVFAADYSTNINSLVDYLKANQDASGKIVGFGGETSWTIMGLSAVGIDPSAVENSGNSFVDFLAANPPAETATTGWERDLLAVAAAGENPFTFGGRNYTSKVESFYDGAQIGSTTTLNDDIFGILSLISAGPSANQEIISDSIDFLIANQNSDGGWSWQVGGSSDSNDTAVAIQALKAANNKGFTNAGLSNASDTGVSYLLSLQQPDGGWEYQSGFGTDAASTAWVVQALISEDSAVTAGLNFLASLQDASGGVAYQAGFGADTFTSSYALAAFAQVAYPVGIFQGEFEEDPGQPTSEETNQDGDEQASDDEGRVLSASDSSEDGKVLAASLPDTGVSSALPVEALEQDLSDNEKGNQINIFLIIGIGLIIVGAIASLIARRYKGNNVD